MPRFNQPLLPTALKKADRTLIIHWNDDHIQRVSFRVLRDACRCAVCNAKREQELKNPTPQGMLKVLSPAEAAPLDIIKMHPAGNYAYSIHFSDGHSTGIYTYEMLRELDAS